MDAVDGVIGDACDDVGEPYPSGGGRLSGWLKMSEASVMIIEAEA